MIKRIKNSLAFRVPTLYKKILSILSSPSGFGNFKPTDEYTIVMLCGLKQLDLLDQALFSILKNFDSIPPIYIFTDKELDPGFCRKKLKWADKFNITVIGWASCIAYHQENKSLSKFIASNPMGLKLAAILQIAEKGKAVLYSDTDVLWFKDPLLELTKTINNDVINLSLSFDYQPAYDQNLISKGGLNILNQRPYYCAGILVFKNLNPQHKNKFDQLIEMASQQSNHFTEQTIFSYLCKIDQNIGLSEEQFILFTEDQFSIAPRKYNIIARHYVGPIRHLFWRDAFYSRIGYC